MFKSDSQARLNNAFGVKQQRWGSNETLPPGPGHYTLPDSCQVKDPDRQLASYISDLERGFYKQKHDIPGVGSYNLAHVQGTSNKELTGGAPNNFTILNRQQNNAFIHRVDIRESPRIH
jgi:hypothetical protein